MPEMFLVGGAVRDKLLGLRPKDLDYVVIADSYDEMKDWLTRGKISQIFLEKPEYGTIRARLSSGEAGDFVLARKDGYYSDGRRPDSTEPGTLMDDLLRRDFTVNAMAEDEIGRIIDPFGGRRDLYALVLRTVRDPKEVFTEDALRMYRAIRFRVTKEFAFTSELHRALRTLSVLDNLPNVSIERVREELYKCFKHDTTYTAHLLDNYYPELRDYAFKGSGMWLKPTMED
jgi:tRNA nucleotidyltransferase (CCA-adding enzyme)